MKRSFLFHLLILALVLSVSATGCRKTPKRPVTAIPGQGTTIQNPPFNPGTANPLPPEPNPNGDNRLSDPDKNPAFGPNARRDESIFASQTVYFDVDKATIKASEGSKIEAVASHLKNAPNAGVYVEGHCDERGTENYNLALGERRAAAVRDYLINLGVAGHQIQTISLGETKPATPGHNEAAWSKNRRARFVLSTAK